MLALSHDEVVHGKKSLLRKMPGDHYAQMAGLRAFYAYMWTTPGKKLLFMGQEFAQATEWNENTELPWYLTDQRDHRGVMLLVRDLNRLYREHPALHAGDHAPEGLLWINADDADASTYSYLRRDPGSNDWLLVVLNMTPVYREGYPVGVPQGGQYQVLLDTDAGEYGGFGTQQGDLFAQEGGDHGQTHRLLLNLAPNSALILRPLPSPAQQRRSRSLWLITAAAEPVQHGLPRLTQRLISRLRAHQGKAKGKKARPKSEARRGRAGQRQPRSRWRWPSPVERLPKNPEPSAAGRPLPGCRPANARRRQLKRMPPAPGTAGGAELAAAAGRRPAAVCAAAGAGGAGVGAGRAAGDAPRGAGAAGPARRPACAARPAGSSTPP